MNILTQLIAYKQWANRLLYRALATLPATERERPRTIGFGSLLRTLHHIYAMDRVWQAHLLDGSHGYNTRNPGDCPAFEQLDPLQSELDAWYLDYAEGLSPQAADQFVAFEFIGGTPGSMRRAEILLHVVTHGSYHRGHVGQMMYDSGAHPPTTDLPVFLRVAGTREL